ncbi:alpha-tocopherol transfer protein-like [Amblyomma americanum]|uniref:CRAL-TRIO domain-containing protein n=1 Tax=Amblyomma americanum TaxID=6943 RepID=A0AAQ4E894_AMBAM
MLGLYRKKSLDDVFDTSEGALPFRLQRVADDELGETSTRRKEALEKLEQLISEEPDFNVSKDKDFLLRFLRVRKYNVDAAMQSIRKYYSDRAACQSVYCDFLPSTITPAARILTMALPGKDAHGRLVLLVKLGAWKPQEVSHTLFQRAGLIVLEHLITDPTAQTLGVCLLMDCHELSVDHVMSLNVGLIKRVLQYFQDGMPARLKAFHVVREGRAFDMLYCIMKPFLKKKLASRFRFHGYNFEDFHKEISPQILPEELGGQSPALDFDAFWSEMDQLETVFAANSRCGYTRKRVNDFATEEEIEKSLEFF